ncbi:hypothetical protein BMR04_12220 [Methylococcaceae bacterium HT3]|nr:hypothetical protein BMR04_12220 [Methylococcaceae bacterium HT3]
MLPMLADKSIPVDNLVKVSKLEMTEENIVGIHLPVIKDRRAMLPHEIPGLLSP